MGGPIVGAAGGAELHPPLLPLSASPSVRQSPRAVSVQLSALISSISSLHLCQTTQTEPAASNQEAAAQCVFVVCLLEPGIRTEPQSQRRGGGLMDADGGDGGEESVCVGLSM